MSGVSHVTESYTNRHITPPLGKSLPLGLGLLPRHHLVRHSRLPPLPTWLTIYLGFAGALDGPDLRGGSPGAYAGSI